MNPCQSLTNLIQFSVAMSTQNGANDDNTRSGYQDLNVSVVYVDTTYGYSTGSVRPKKEDDDTDVSACTESTEQASMWFLVSKYVYMDISFADVILKLYSLIFRWLFW